MDIWCEKYRPKTLRNVILSPANRNYFDNIKSIENNYLFIGSAGCGKTTMAKILASQFAPESYLYLNASDESGIDVIRSKVKDFSRTMSFDGAIKLVILDEADGLSSASSGGGSSAQQALRNMMEENLDSVRFILTANYKQRIIEPLQSRCVSFDFALSLDQCVSRLEVILGKEGIKYDRADVIKLAQSKFPDMRSMINILQKSSRDNVFTLGKVDVGSKFANLVKGLIDEKKDVFQIRKVIIDHPDKFGGDYQALLRDIFQLYCVDKNMKAARILADRIYRHDNTVDKEVNFSSALFELFDI